MIQAAGCPGTMFAAELSSVGAAPASPQAAVGLKWALELCFTPSGPPACFAVRF